jgi:hypothetical protein
MANSINETAIKKLSLLFTVVERGKGEFYTDVLSQFEVNCQMVLNGKGTANSDLVEMLGLQGTVFAILMGTSFSWIDLLCYGAGCLLFAGAELLWKHLPKK